MMQNITSYIYENFYLMENRKRMKYLGSDTSKLLMKGTDQLKTSHAMIVKNETYVIMVIILLRPNG